MRYRTLATTALVGLAFALPAGMAEATTAWIYDGDGSSTGPTGTYSRVTNITSGGSGWKDVIGYPKFDTSAIKIDFTGTNVTFTTYTNYTWKGFPKIGLADWGFDLDRDGTYEVAFALRSTSTVGNIKGDLRTGFSWQDSETVMSSLGYGGYTFGRRTAVCDGTASNCQANMRKPEVRVDPNNNGSIVSGYNDITVSDGGSGTNPNPFTGTASYLHSYSFTLAGINDGTHGHWNNLGVFWATGWCSNDSIEGVVPIPAALPLMLSALGGLGLVGWRRRASS